MTRLVVMVLGLLFVTTAHAFHVCPTLDDDVAVRRPVPVDGAKAMKAREKLAARIAEGKKLPPGQLKKAIEDDAAARAPELRAYCRANPDGCFAALLGDEDRAAVATGCVEGPATIEGTMALSVTLPTSGDARTEQWSIIQDNGRRLVVSAAESVRQGFRAKRRLKLQGVVLGDTDLFVAADGVSGPLVEAPNASGFEAPPPWVKGPVRVLLTAVAFADSPFNYGLDALRLDAQRVQDYYRENSHGQSQMTITVFPRVITVPQPTTSSPGTDHDLVLPFIDSEVDFTQVDIWGIISDGGPWPFGGVAFIGTVPQQTGEGTRYLGLNMNRSGRAGTIIHEVGHNFGLHHGASYTAPGWFPDGGVNSVTKWVEYQHPNTAMGQAGGDGPFGAMPQYDLGWLAAPDVLVNPPPGRYTLVPVGLPLGSGAQGVMLRLASVDYAVLELRRPINRWEQTAPSLKRFGCYLLSSGMSPYPHEADHKLDARATPGCQAGDTITHPVTGASMTVESVTDTAMVVRVDADGTPDLIAPSLAFTSPAFDATVTNMLHIVLDATDAGGVFTTHAKIECGGRALWAPSRDAVPPYEMDIDITSCPNGYAWMYGYAVDRVGQTKVVSRRVLVQNDGSATTSTTSTSSTTQPTTTIAPTTTSTRPTTTSTTTSTSRPPTTLRPTTTTVRPTTTTTTTLCRVRGKSCVLNGVKHPELCCSRRCAGGKKCR